MAPPAMTAAHAAAMRQRALEPVTVDPFAVATSSPQTDAALLTDVGQVMATSSTPLSALLDIALRCLSTQCPCDQVTAAVLMLCPDDRSWTVLGSTDATVAERLPELTADIDGAVAQAAQDLVANFDRPLPIRSGRHSVVALQGNGELLGVLLLLECSPKRWATHSPTTAAVTMSLGGAIIRENVRADTAAAARKSHALSRLFQEASRANDIHQAGAVLADVAREAFGADRAAMCFLDANGVITSARGVGVGVELSDAIAAAVVGTVADDSPIWRALRDTTGPVFGDAVSAPGRPGGLTAILELTSHVTIPLTSGATFLGAVICGDTAGERHWTHRDRELAAELARAGTLIVDAARLRESEQAQLGRLTREAYSDNLTGIPNRRLLMERLDAAMRAAHSGAGTVALLLLDLDDFKRVNDTLGHRHGDQLLCEVGRRLAGALRRGDTVARLGGDEFAVLLQGAAALDDARRAAARVEQLLSAPIDLDSVSLTAVASIGIALFPDHADTTSDLLQCADIAMYAAKRAGGGTAVYDASQSDATLENLTLLTDLRHGVDDGQLRLEFQPQIDLRRNVVTGVEALVRWQHPRRGRLAPGAFLPVAESTGLIGPLTCWVVEHALTQWNSWRDMTASTAAPTVDVAVNLSVRNLLDRDLLHRIHSLIREHGAAEHVVLEVTETAVVHDVGEAAKALERFRALGCRISLDDFGTGYSSLTQVSQLPVDELKIDRMLVRDIDTNDRNHALVETIIALGHRLGLTVVAEGIETAQNLQTVQALGCDLGQGYYLSRPVPASAISQLLTVPRLPAAAGPAEDRAG